MRTLVVVTLAVGLAAAVLSAAEYPSMGPDIFDPHEKGEKLIDGAVRRAASERKRVLLLFGANWCPWCRRLHRALETQPAVTARVARSFVLVFIDANTRADKNRNAAAITRYGNPLQYGLPVFVVLDHEGKQLTTRETGSLAGKNPAEEAANIAAFLDEWAAH